LWDVNSETMPGEIVVVVTPALAAQRSSGPPRWSDIYDMDGSDTTTTPEAANERTRLAPR
jgi:hypothetical protein